MRTLRLLVYLEMLSFEIVCSSMLEAINLSLQEEGDKGYSSQPISLLTLFIKSRRETKRLA